jgi:hypothetical protein
MLRLSSCQTIKQGEKQNIGAATTPPFPAFGQAAVRPGLLPEVHCNSGPDQFLKHEVATSASNSSAPILRT